MADWYASLDVPMRDALLVIGIAALTNVACACWAATSCCGA